MSFAKVTAVDQSQLLDVVLLLQSAITILNQCINRLLVTVVRVVIYSLQ